MGVPTVAAYRSVLGMILRSRRERAGLSPKQVAATLGWYSGVKVSKIEAGAIKLAEDELLSLLRLYQVNDSEISKVAEFADKARRRPEPIRSGIPVNPYQFFLAESTEINAYAEAVLPEFLQTRDYAAALLSTSLVVSAADVVDHAENRAAARHFLTSESAPQCNIVLGESILVTPVGGKNVFRGQLESLRELADLPNVTVRIIPFARGEHVALGSPFTVLTLTIPRFTTVYTEGLTEASYLGDWANTEIYRLAFRRLSDVALSRQDSLALLDREIMQER